MKELFTKRLRLRPWKMTDAPFLLDLESRYETMRYLGPGVSLMETIEQAQASIQRRRNVCRTGQGIWAIERRDTGRLVGNLLCKPMSKNMHEYIGINLEDQPCEIGWHLHPEAQGHGFATEAASVVLEYAREANDEREIFAIVDPLNAPSLKICHRLGLRYLGRTSGYVNPEHLVHRAPLNR